MSAPRTERSVQYVYCIIGNIPFEYRSSDLRNYFSQFVESRGFDCFHFRHRPEKKHPNDQAAASENAIEIDKIKVQCQQPEKSERDFSMSSQPNQSAASRNDISDRKNPFVEIKTNCCIVRLTETNLQRVLKMYHRKHWLDRDGNMIQSRCFIARIKTSSDNGIFLLKKSVRNKFISFCNTIMGHIHL